MGDTKVWIIKFNRSISDNSHSPHKKKEKNSISYQSKYTSNFVQDSNKENVDWDETTLGTGYAKDWKKNKCKEKRIATSVFTES